MALTPKQQLFVLEYLKDLNATQAAIRAGYSKKTADRIAHENLRKPEIAAAIATGRQTRADAVKVAADDVLRELVIIGTSDVRHFVFNPATGAMELAAGAPDTAWRAVASVKHKVKVTPRGKDEKGNALEPEREHTVEMRLWDKNTAVQNIGRHLGMFVDKKQHEFPGGIPIGGGPSIDQLSDDELRALALRMAKTKP